MEAARLASPTGPSARLSKTPINLAYQHFLAPIGGGKPVGAPVGADMANGGTQRPLAGRKRPPSGDTRWLELRGRTWFAVQDVPRPLRSALGRKRMVKSLATRDLHVAVAKRHAVLAEFQRAFTAAGATSQADPITTSAMIWRTTLAQADHETTSGANDDDPSDGAREALTSEVAAAAERIEAEHGHDRARAFYEMATGRATPLLHHVDAWLAEGGTKGPLKPRTANQYRSDLGQLHAWLTAARVPPTVEAVTKIVAGRYVTEGLLGTGTDRATANRKISAPSAYWRWLMKRTGATVNPWAGQSLSKVAAGAPNARYKRPFTDLEVATLLAGNADLELADAMRVAALSGMRIEEIYRLRVRDTANGLFRLTEAKTRAGVRIIPVHTDLAALVARRQSGKGAPNYLFHEPGAPRAGRERSMATSKRFGHYRARLRVDEHEAGRRQSNVDFHSLRRWFVTTARAAGIDRATVAAVVGHEAGNITDDIYSGGPSEALKRACVEAVRLPLVVGPLPQRNNS